MIAIWLACAGSAHSDEPLAETPTQETTVVQEATAEDLARAWGAERTGEAQVQTKVLDKHTGLDAIGVYESSTGRYLPVVVLQGEVLEGPDGFRRFVELDGRTDALRVAGAYSHLQLGLLTEVLGDWRVHRKAATWPDPRWDGDELVFLVQDGGEQELRVTLAANGTPTEVGRQDGRGMFLSPRRASGNR